jgi:hypothetical protein
MNASPGSYQVYVSYGGYEGRQDLVVMESEEKMSLTFKIVGGNLSGPTILAGFALAIIIVLGLYLFFRNRKNRTR